MAKKNKTFFVCQNCGYQHIRYQGQCSSCGSWNSLVEEVSFASKNIYSDLDSKGLSIPKPLKDIVPTSTSRIVTPDEELNRVLGGGIVAGSLILLGGEPGIGKSTLLLQVALQLADYKILYVSGEESEQQIKMRADRIGIANEGLYVLAETQLEKIIDIYRSLKPDLLIIDSIQTIHTGLLDSAPGSVSQVRESTSKLMRMAKSEGKTPIFLVGHITKEGSLAGPKVMEHMVDAVLSFEGDQHNSYRIIRNTKNRFGSTLEIGIYEMLGKGLREVRNPSEIFLSQSDEVFSGVAIGGTIEGMRPLLVEMQALVSPMTYGNPQRSATGFDLRRLNMLLAVLEKRCGFKLSVHDVFINVTGGLKIEDPAMDLALTCAIISSLYDLPIPRSYVFSAEIGLSGEVRSVNRLESRISEAEKLGFRKIFMSDNQSSTLEKSYKNIEIKGVDKLEEVFSTIFSNFNLDENM